MVLLGLSAAASSLAAPRFLGPNRCSSCHDHDKQKEWADKDKHARALAQLEDKNAARYSGAIGLADPYNLKGSCVACHATVFSGDANAGVSCETCHGAGSDYLEPHQQKGSHSKSVTLGLIDTRGNSAVWSRLCVNCHVLTDKSLIAAGHKSGADFDVGAESRKIVHWKETYDFGKLSAEGKAAMPKAAGARAATAVPTARPMPAPTVKPTPAPTAASPPSRAISPTPASALPTSAPAAASPPSRAISPTPAPALPTPAPAAPVRPVEATAPPSPAATPDVATPLDKTPPAPPEGTTTPSPEGKISIEIRATPIPTVTPFSPPPPPTKEGLSVAPTAGITPAPRSPTHAARSPRPRPKRVSTPTTPFPMTPSPTLTPTKIRAPQEPPRRAPH